MLWIGTNGFGIFKVNLHGPTFKSYLPKTTQRKIVEDPKGNLITAHDIHVQYSSTRFDQIEPNRSFIHARDYPWQLSALFDPEGNCWVTDPGEPFLYRTDAQSNEKKAFPWTGIGLCYNQKGRLLSVSGEGLFEFDPTTEQSKFYPFKTPMQQRTEFSQFFWEDSEGMLWIFGFEGLIKAISNGTGYQFEYFVNNPQDRSTLSSNIVLSVADDPLEPTRYLWVGTKSGGLNRLDKQSGTLKQYKREHGLPDNVIYGVLAENPSTIGRSAGKHIWLSTNKGLCRFDVQTETTKNFTVADGLQDNEFNSSSYLKTRDGTMIFGGVKGLTVFHPDSLRFNTHIPQIRIVGLSVNNKDFDISGKSSITLSHNQNLLTFDFAALEFTNPAQNQYRYQLMDVDKDWVDLGARNSVQFANLAPGTYTFKVLGSNNDGVWSEQPAELRFTIRPPWWASWWAYLLYLAIAVTAARLYYRYRLQLRLEHQEALRLAELDDFKSRFFTNITHEFRTPLTVMLGMSEQLAKEEKDEPKRNKLGLIKRSGENLLRLVNQILDLAKLESNALKINYIQGDVLTFLKYIAESLHSLANAQNLLLRVESDQAKIVMDYDPERFLQIIHNLLSNAIKFTPSGGKVLLRADLKDKWLHITVTDSGAGIPAEELPNLFERFFQAKNQEHAKAGGTGIGLSLTHELVKAMGGEISVDSKVGVGSTFLVKLPVTNSSVFEEKLMPIDGVTRNLPVKRSLHSDGVTPSHPVTMQTVLLIEDNPDVVEYLNACLDGQFHLDFAYNGQAGIEKALENIPDLIVSDVMMPMKDGFEVVEALKNNALTSHIPIILLTAKADVQSRLAGLRKGADAYLSKPFHAEELLVTIENLLELRRKLQLKYQQYALSPTVPEGAETADMEDGFLQKVREVIEANYPKEDFGLPQLCQKIGMSRSQLFRKMKALTDMAPSDLIRSHRLNKAKVLLESGAANVAEAAWKVGFKDPSYFSKLYQEEFGVAPSYSNK
ncbi:MAG: response regulator [Lewinellaceae bacterium]|nr:response regulator [Lewinellaceae bacterium]